MGWYRFPALIESKSSVPLFVLQEPNIVDGEVRERGVVLIGHKIVDDIIEKYGEDFKKFWFVISTCQSSTFGQSVYADLHLFSDKANNDDYLKSPAGDIPFINMSGGLFVDPEEFYPETSTKEYDVLYIAKWFKTKRLELYIDAINKMPEVRAGLLTFGVVTEKNKDESYDYSIQIKEYLKKNNSRIELIEAPEGEHLNKDGSLVPGGFTKEEMRGFINRSKITVLLADINEAYNRAVCESLCCDVPVIVTSDTLGGVPSLLNSKMGKVVEPTPLSISEGIEEVLGNLDFYKPREEFLRTYGTTNSNAILREKVSEISTIQGSKVMLREESLYHGDPWTMHIYEIVEKYSYK